VDEASGNQWVYLERGERMLTFSFAPGDHEHPDKLREEWLNMLNSVVLNNKRGAVPTTPSTGTGGVGGMPCGGTAGILCPTGFYCDVTHLEENVGVCRRM